MFLRQSTSQIIRFGPFLDSTDGVTPETALTIAQADMQLSKDGALFAQKNAAGNATHDTDGWYSTTLDATDTATNGELLMQVNVSGALPVWARYYVVPAATYDALTTNGLNNVAATDIVSAGAITTLSGAVVNVDTVDVCTTNTDMRGTDSALLAASYTAPDNATISTINTKIDDVPTVAEFNARTLPSASYFDFTTDQVIVATNNDKTGYTVSSVTDKAGYSIAGSITTLDGLNNISVSDVLTTQMTESYAADGVAPSLSQAVFLTMQSLNDFSYSGVTQTVKRIDGTTTAATFTLDSSTDPITSKTRST